MPLGARSVLLFREQLGAHQTLSEAEKLECRLTGRHEYLPARYEKQGRYAKDFNKD